MSVLETSQNEKEMNEAKSGVSTSVIYHEKQSLQRCGIHALNNLFQGPVFSTTSFNEICNKLAPDSWINPHKSVLGLGNYDVNVMIAAVESRGYVLKWLDNRKVSVVNSDSVLGFIVNVTVPR